MPKKGEKLDEAQLLKLAEARKKALEVRQEKATVKKQEKELAGLERKDRSSHLKKQIDERTAKSRNLIKDLNQAKIDAAAVSQRESDSDEEAPAPCSQARAVKPARKAKQQVAAAPRHYECDDDELVSDDSSSEEEIIAAPKVRGVGKPARKAMISQDDRNAIIQQHYDEQQALRDEQDRQRYLGQAGQVISQMAVRGGVRTNLFG